LASLACVNFWQKLIWKVHPIWEIPGPFVFLQNALVISLLPFDTQVCYPTIGWLLGVFFQFLLLPLNSLANLQTRFANLKKLLPNKSNPG